MTDNIEAQKRIQERKKRLLWERGSRLDKMCCDIFFTKYEDWKIHRLLEHR